MYNVKCDQFLKREIQNLAITVSDYKTSYEVIYKTRKTKQAKQQKLKFIKIELNKRFKKMNILESVELNTFWIFQLYKCT